VKRPLIVNPEAEADLEEARAWHEAQRQGLGDEFLECVREVFDRIQPARHLYGKVYQELRLALVRRFPYAVVYRVDDEQITVVAVYHTRREPRGWLGMRCDNIRVRRWYRGVLIIVATLCALEAISDLAFGIPFRKYYFRDEGHPHVTVKVSLLLLVSVLCCVECASLFLCRRLRHDD
jgi:plasmid stabilization system protein ParE